MTDWRVIGRRSGGVEVKKRLGKLDGRGGREAGSLNSEGKEGKTEDVNDKGWARFGTGVSGVSRRGDKEKAAGAECERIKTARCMLTQHCATQLQITSVSLLPL